MKQLLFYTFVLFSLTGFGQNKPKVDTVYYLLDTAKTLPTDRMWETNKSGGIKLLCNCLKDGGQPILFYSSIANRQMIDPHNLKKFKLNTLPQLITRLQSVLNDRSSLETVAFYLIMSAGKNYIIHRATPANSFDDVLRLIPDDGAFLIPGLKKITPDLLKANLNKDVITEGRIASFRIDPVDKDFILLGANKDDNLAVMIRSSDRIKFDLSERFKGKKIKVTGQVIDHKGTPVILITNEKQIQIIP